MACSCLPHQQAQTRWGAPSQALSAGGLAPSHPTSARSGPPPEMGLRQGQEWGQRIMATCPHCAQGQVTRAQEAEENYVIKRELAVVRQQCSSAAEDLQKAQSTIRQLQEQQVPPRLPELPGAWGGRAARLGNPGPSISHHSDRGSVGTRAPGNQALPAGPLPQLMWLFP